MDDRIDLEDSATRQLIALPIGGCYARASVLTGSTVDTNDIVALQRNLARTVGTAIVRAKRERPSRIYSIHSAHAFTQSLDVVITVAVLREG